MSPPRRDPAGETVPVDGRYLLWIDGVGGYLLLTNPMVTIGGTGGNAADVQLLASLSRHHVTLHRDGGGYLLEAMGPTRVDGRRVVEWVGLGDEAEIALGDTVRLKFHRPTVLSPSARLEFLSDHRPVHSLDGVVLVEDTCLLGPGRDCHIVCPDWSGTLVLVHRDGRWLVRGSGMPLEIEGMPVGAESEIGEGQVVAGSDLSFRIETMAGPAVETAGRRWWGGRR